MHLNRLKYGAAFLLIFVMLMCPKGGGWLLAGTDPAGDSSGIQSGIRIIVNETSLVNQDHIFLGDIAQIHANGFLKDGLARIEISPSPKPDKIKSIAKRKIISVINAQQFLTGNVTIQSPDQIYVKRAAQKISKEDIRAFILQKVSQIFKNRDHQLVSLNVRGLEPYAQGDLLFRLTSNDIVDKNGRLTAFVEVGVNGIKQDKLSVSGQVEVYENVLCAGKGLKKGQSMSRSDVVLKRKNVFDLSDDIIRNFDELDQKILRSGVKKNEYLKASSFEVRPLVKKGDIIRILSRNENLLIVTSGISKEDGFADKLIKVENLSSGKLVRGIVKGNSTVEVVH